MKIIDDARTCIVEDPNLAEYLNVAADAQREGAFERADEILRALIAEHPLSALPVEILCPLPIRATRALTEGSVRTLATLVQCKLSDTRWREFGPTSRARLGARMRVFGLNLAEQRDYAWIKSSSTRRAKVTGAINRLLILPTFVTK